MSYVAEPHRSTGDLITAAIWNQAVSDNPAALYAGAMAMASQAAEEPVITSSATQLKRIALTALQSIRKNAGNTAIEVFTPSSFGGAEADLSFTDITTNDVSTTKHGFAPKGDGSTRKFLNANGAYSKADLQLLASGSGTDTSAGAANFVTYTFGSGELDITDTIVIEYVVASITQSTTNCGIRNITNGVFWSRFNGFSGASSISAGETFYGRLEFRRTQASNTVIMGFHTAVNQADTYVAEGRYLASSLAAGWTSGFQIGLNHQGVTGGGTFQYSAAIWLRRGGA